MSHYRISLLDADGVVGEERALEFERDDDAIDHAGSIEHRHEIQLWRGERLVARFPPISTSWAG